MNLNPRSLIGEVRQIIAAADCEARDLTAPESVCCDRLLDAAQALAELAKLNDSSLAAPRAFQ